MKYIDVDHLRAAIKEHTLFYAGQANLLDGTNTLDGYDEVLAIIDSLQQEQLEVFDTVAFQKGVQEGRRLEREDALTIADIEKLHTFLYAVKNNKQGAFTFTRLSNEQYEEVLRRFNNAKEK